ncbi:MAG: hypothetical protein NT165_01740 [Candidatus Falkowbacteria bacterium]|nr:hypothetical protein [Candidatus Falkowbacteria bacterium]
MRALKQPKGANQKDFGNNTSGFENKNQQNEKQKFNPENPSEVLRVVYRASDEKMAELAEKANRDQDLENSAGELDGEAEVEAKSIDNERTMVVVSGKKEIDKIVQNFEDKLDPKPVDLEEISRQIAACRERINLAEKAEDLETYEANEKLVRQLEKQQAEGVLVNNKIAEKLAVTENLNSQEQALIEEIKAHRELIRAAEQKNETGTYDEKAIEENEELLHQKEKALQEIRETITDSNKTEVAPSKFESLSPGQQKFVKDGLVQLYLEEARTKAQEQFNQATDKRNGETSWNGRMWKKMTRGFQLAKLEKANLQSTSVDSEDRLLYAERLVDIAKGMGKEMREEDGKLVIDFNTFEGLSADSSQAFEAFNAKANEFSSMPQEWAFESAKSSDRTKFEKAKHEYETQKLDLLDKIIAEKGEMEALQGVNDIDNQVAMRQFLTNHPEVQKEFDHVKNDSPYKRLFSSLLAERGAMTGAGFAARNVAKYAGHLQLVSSAVSLSAMPVIAGVIGAWRGRARADKKIKEGDIQGRHQEKGESALSQERGALLIGLQKLVPAEFSLSPDEWLAEQATEEEKTAYQELKDKFDKVNAKFEKSELGISRNADGTVKKIKRGLEANISQAGDLTDKLNQAVTRFEQAVQSNESPERLEELRGALTSRLEFSQNKLEDGLVGFGSGAERSAKYLSFTQALEKAKVLHYYSENTDKVNERVVSFMDHLKGEISSKRSSYKNQQMVLGALMGAAAFGVGMKLREGAHALYEGSALQETVNETFSKIGSGVKELSQDIFGHEKITKAAVVGGTSVSQVGGMEMHNIAQNEAPSVNESAKTVGQKSPSGIVNKKINIPKVKIETAGAGAKIPDMYDSQGNKIAFLDEKGNAILSDGRLISKEFINGVPTTISSEGAVTENLAGNPAPDNLQEVKLGGGVSAFNNNVPQNIISEESNTLEDLNENLNKEMRKIPSMDGKKSPLSGLVNKAVSGVKNVAETPKASSVNLGVNNFNNNEGLPNLMSNDMATATVETTPEVSAAMPTSSESLSAVNPSGDEGLPGIMSSDNAGEVSGINQGNLSTADNLDRPINLAEAGTLKGSSVFDIPEKVNIPESNNLSNNENYFGVNDGSPVRTNASEIAVSGSSNSSVTEKMDLGRGPKMPIGGDIVEPAKNVIPSELTNQNLDYPINNGQEVTLDKNSSVFNTPTKSLSQELAEQVAKSKLANSELAGISSKLLEDLSSEKIASADDLVNNFGKLNEGLEVTSKAKEALYNIWDAAQYKVSNPEYYAAILAENLRTAQHEVLLSGVGKNLAEGIFTGKPGFKNAADLIDRFRELNKNVVLSGKEKALLSRAWTYYAELKQEGGKELPRNIASLIGNVEDILLKRLNG